MFSVLGGFLGKAFVGDLVGGTGLATPSPAPTDPPVSSLPGHADSPPPLQRSGAFLEHKKELEETVSG